MAQFSKFLNVNENVLLEWIFDDSDFISEDYKVLNNLNNKTNSFISTTNLNKLSNTAFIVDDVTSRYSPVNTENFSFLKLQSYSSSNVPYNTIKINLPSFFNFEDDDYKGFIIRIYTYDISNKKIVPFSTYYYDDTDNLRQNQLEFRKPFLYNNVQWSKYIQFKIPDIEYISNQRITENDGTNKPIDNTINYELTKGVGISQDSPIFIDFSFIKSIKTIFGVKYFTAGDNFSTSIPKVPEYQDLGVVINESSQGDYYEIYGKWDGSNETFDDFVEKLEQRGMKIRVEYDISTYEENILQNTQTFLVTKNFSQKIIYRPIITFSNTTAIIDVQMKIKDVINNETISRRTSIGISGNELLKYGANLRRINVNNAIKPKIYNLKTQNTLPETEVGQTITVVEKIPYPILYERYNILASASAAINSDFVGFGQLQIILSPVDTVIRFIIAKKIDSDSDVEFYNLSKISQNSKVILRFETDDKSKQLDKEMFYEADNDLANGVVHFKILESDLFTIKSIYSKSKKFYIIILNEDDESRILLYSGTFRLFNDTEFSTVGVPNSVINNQNNLTFGDDEDRSSDDLQDLSTDDVSNTTEKAQEQDDDIETDDDLDVADAVNEIKRQNIIVFLKRNANEVLFERSLSNIINTNNFSNGGQIYIKYNRSYIIIAVTESETEEIFKIKGVDSDGSSVIPFELGKSVAKDLTNNLGKVKELEMQANDIFEEWIQSAEFDGTGDESFDAPTETSKKELINQVEEIVNELNNLGFKLGKNPSTDTMWLAVPDDGEGSHYIGI